MSPERLPDEQPEPFILEQVIDIAKDVALERGSHIPTLIVEGSQSAAIIQIDPLAETHEEKLKQMFEIGFGLALQRQMGNLHQLFFISEAWLSTRKADEPLTLLPSEDPDRVEVLIINYLNMGNKRSDLVVLQMIRDDKGKLSDLFLLQAAQSEGEEAPGQEQQVESPLLEAFTTGFVLASLGQDN